MQKQNNPLVLSVITHHGHPCDVGGVPTLASSTITREVPYASLKEVPSNEDIDELVLSFQAHNTCMVAYDDERPSRLTFEVLEPSWPTSDIASFVGLSFLNELMGLMTDHQTNILQLS